MEKKLAIIGRPNVGKSTLFNRLALSKRAIVHDTPGVTRDRHYSKAGLGDLDFTIIDTPGFEKLTSQLTQSMIKQVQNAIDEANVIAFVVDGKAGITYEDKQVADIIKRSKVPIVLVINKCESGFDYDQSFFKLGFEKMVMISAEHNLGMADFYHAVKPFLQHGETHPELEAQGDTIKLAIIGRPNSGKSTFINSLLGSNRLITGPEAGITRDAIDINFEYQGTSFILVDTAGMRKKSNITQKLEKLSVTSSIKSIYSSNITVLMIDATIGLEKQDLNIANLAIESGKGLIVIFNKMDLVKNQHKYKKDIEFLLETHLGQIKNVPVVFASALLKENIYQVMEIAAAVNKKLRYKISTSKLNNWLKLATEEHLLPFYKDNRRIRIKYVTQVGVVPPMFKFFANIPEMIPDSYKRYLTNSLASSFKLESIPIRMIFAKSDNPYS